MYLLLLGSQGQENVLVKALREVLEDRSFQIKTPTTIKTREAAEKFLEWCLNDSVTSKVNKFSSELKESLQKVINGAKQKTFTYNKEKIWKQFFLLRSSKEFTERRRKFLPTISPPVEPVLYQHLTDSVFKLLIQNHFKVVHLDQEPAEMNVNERNVLRYIAGYVCRKLRTKIERENHDLKEEMVLCLMELVKDGDVCETDEEWTNLVDRGGLWHVKTTTYQLFCAIEYQIRESLSLFSKAPLPAKDKMIKDIASHEDVQFYWLISTADFEIEDQDVHDLLLTKIVKEFLTLRSFSRTSALMENFKQSAKKSTQRARSLRSELCNMDD